MKLKQLTLHNFQTITDFDGNFSGNVYLVTGDNEVGKSTLLKAICALLTGERDAVLKNGESKGFAKAIIGDEKTEYEVKLSMTENNPRGTLTITSKTGLKTNNVSALQSIFGYKDFDAVEFSRWSETAEGRRRQIEVVKNLLPTEVRERIEQIDSTTAQVKENRKNANAEIKSLTAICGKYNLSEQDKTTYATKRDLSDLAKKQEEEIKLNAKVEQVRAMLAQRTQQLADIPGRIEEENNFFDDCKTQEDEALRQAEEAMVKAKRAYEAAKDAHARNIANLTQDHATKLQRIEEEKADYEKRKANAESWLKQYEAANADKKDTAQEIASIEEHNKMCDKVAEYNKFAAQLTTATEEKESLEGKLAELTAERAELVTKSNLPITGLTFTDDGLELNGVPFVPGKVSDSQIMEVAAKLIIASNPTTKVFCIARGESLGAARLKAIVDMAKANGFQGFLEEVRRGQEELVIEEYTEN